MFESGLKPGEVVNNRRLMDIFHCACEGGIRYSSRTGTIILVVNNTKSGLPNRRIGDILEFAGRPSPKGQILEGANRRLQQFLNEQGDVFLFEVNHPGQYEYRGIARLAGQPRMETASGHISYPVFPLKLETAPHTA